jgi:hypothetical protein
MCGPSARGNNDAAALAVLVDGETTVTAVLGIARGLHLTAEAGVIDFPDLIVAGDMRAIHFRRDSLTELVRQTKGGLALDVKVARQGQRRFPFDLKIAIAVRLAVNAVCGTRRAWLKSGRTSPCTPCIGIETRRWDIISGSPRSCGLISYPTAPYNSPSNIEITQNNTAAKRNVAKEPNPITPTRISGALRDFLATPL